MAALAKLIGQQITTLMTINRVHDDAHPAPIGVDQFEWEEHLRHQVEDTPGLDHAQKEQIILARRVQGVFKNNVSKIEHHCRVTKVNRNVLADKDGRTTAVTGFNRPPCRLSYGRVE